MPRRRTERPSGSRQARTWLHARSMMPGGGADLRQLRGAIAETASGAGPEVLSLLGLVGARRVDGEPFAGPNLRAGESIPGLDGGHGGAEPPRDRRERVALLDPVGDAGAFRSRGIHRPHDRV